MGIFEQGFPLAASLLCVFIKFKSYLQFVIIFAKSFVKWSKYTYINKYVDFFLLVLSDVIIGL